MKLGTASLGCPSVVLKIGLCRVIRIGDVIIRVGTRLLVISGENINGRGVGCRARLSLHIPLAKVLEDLFNHIGIFYERDHPHHPLAFGADQRIDFIDLRDAEHHMPMRYGLYHLLTKPLTKRHHPFLMAGRAKMDKFIQPLLVNRKTCTRL